ncbi:unnamed protein product [Prorocentrum cordatum]|uniref:Uncharacterized protein n=1 Tax=Prorocentrum cordatum TaxID=2364126 RepID=A0ABN9TY67_9DINO|nr:unnamed protein product [Polarella glacialis]
MKRLKRSRALRRWRATGEDAETKKEDGKDGNEGKKENEADKPEALADAGWIIQEPYVSDVLDAAKAASGLPVSAVDFVEMCGGCSRVPWVKEMCSQAFGGKELSTTMNADECVARGCTLQVLGAWRTRAVAPGGLPEVCYFRFFHFPPSLGQGPLPAGRGGV